MKKITGLFFILTFSAGISFAQNTSPYDNAAIDQEDFLKKSRSQRTIGWIMAGTGTALVATGFVVAFADAMETAFSGDSYNKTGEAMIIGGVACAAGSIPLFIAANKNKKKARLAIGTQTIPVGFRPGQQLRYPSAGIRIQLGK